MFKKVLSAILTISLITGLTACGNKEVIETKEASSTSAGDKKIQVVVTFNPMREFAEAIGKDKIEIKTIVPEGMEPHDFEPKPRDMESINKADIFVYNGLGMEAWVEKTLEAVDNKSINVVGAYNGAELIANEDEEEIEEHGQFDPHIWLSLKEAKVQAKNIKDALVKADEKNKDFYEANYNEFTSKLDALYNEYKDKFRTLANKNFVTGHAAFGYICRDFGLVQKSVEDVFAEGEPTMQKLKELTEFSKKNNIKTIFMEELASPKVSETLAQEVGAKVEKIYTIESKEDGKDYIASMRENLDRIYNSLK
jgi:zinc transport system substrate-binding protein